ncbi:hypothetical protein D9758_018317 [Tetrapyrgos nigripes]|uniref:Uncharacterized protein n=1 Tax=Tetrapyrgos nigripes TaxID=182062 RepID=A0A8H5F9P7_9AGAR|nr:hypothetical protein D9758_018317 [Tetrapyrgos nigripes]
MIFSRAISFVSLLTVFLSFTFVAANPVTFTGARSDVSTVGKRQDTDITSILTDLQSQVGQILPQIDTLVANGNANDATVTPLINQLTSAIGTSNDNLNKLPEDKKHKGDKDEIAKIIAFIVTDITKTLNGLLLSGAFIPGLGALLVTVDVVLNKLLTGVELLLAGVLKLVAVLLVDVAALLKSISFGLVLAALGF